MAISNFVRNVIEEYKQSTTNPTPEGFLQFIKRCEHIIGGIYLYEHKTEICKLIMNNEVMINNVDK